MNHSSVTTLQPVASSQSSLLENVGGQIDFLQRELVSVLPEDQITKKPPKLEVVVRSVEGALVVMVHVDYRCTEDRNAALLIINRGDIPVLANTTASISSGPTSAIRRVLIRSAVAS